MASKSKYSNPMMVAMVKAARSGDVRYARSALFGAGLALKNDTPLDPILREYIGETLLEVGMVALRDHTKTESRAIEISKALGLVETKGKKPKRFRKILPDLALAGMVLYQHEEKGKPLTRRGAFAAAAKVESVIQKRKIGPSTVEAAYLRVRSTLDPKTRETIKNRARMLLSFKS